MMRVRDGVLTDIVRKDATGVLKSSAQGSVNCAKWGGGALQSDDLLPWEASYFALQCLVGTHHC